MLMFLNEKSCTSTEDQEVAHQAMLAFVGVCRAVRGIYRGTTLVSEVPLDGLEIAPGYYLGEWRNRPDAHDAVSFLRRTLMSKAPISSVLPTAPENQFVEYRHEGTPVLGLAAAHLMDGLAVSLPTAPCWDDPWVRAEYEGVGEEEGYHSGVADVRHASRVEHVTVHEKWIRTAGTATATTAAELWETRATLYPRLQFLPRVEKDLLHLDHKWFLPVRSLLCRLEDSVATWDPAESPFPVWQTPHITPEGEQGKLHCQFKDLDGSTGTFDLHGRMTPGKGRLHFRLIPEQKTLRVAYIGPKLTTT